MAVDPQVRALARRIHRLERQSLIRKQPQLAFSSIHDGAITAVDVEDNPTMVIGKQHDETSTAAVVTGPPPPTPLAPAISEVLGGLVIYWDGTFADGSVAPMDFSRVTIHAYPSATFTAFDPLDQTHIVGTFSSATGGEMLVGLPYVEHLVFLVAWSQAGKFSEESVASFGTPAKVRLPDLGTDTEAELAKAQEALTKADAAGADAATALSTANSAQTTADQAAADAADAAGLVDGKAVIRIQGTAPAAEDQNANTLWIDTADGNKPKRWNATTSTWDAVQDQAAITAAADAAAAQTAASEAKAQAQSAHDTAVAAANDADAAGVLAQSAMDSADSKNTIARATYPPLNEANRPGDLWWYRDAASGQILGLYQGLGADANGVYQWAEQTITNEIIGNLDAGKITFGTMSGERIEANTLVIGQVQNLSTTLAEKATETYVDTAAADAVTTADLNAETKFGGTRDRVTGWTYSGKTTINGGAIETDTVTAIQIEAGTITAVEADLQKLWTGFMSAGHVQAGFVLAGKLQVGQSTWDPQNGLVIPQPDGGTIRLPVDGVTPARITAHLVAKSLNVEDALTITGVGEVQGLLTLTNGITPPKSSPSLFQTWPSMVAPAIGDGEEDNGDIYMGLSEFNSTLWSMGVNYFGAGIRLINKSDGSIGQYPDPTNGKAWCADFYPKAYAAGGGIHYLIGTDNTRNADTYLYRIDGSYNKSTEIKIGPMTAFGSRPALCWDPANSELLMVWADKDNNLLVRRLDRISLDTLETRTLVSAMSYRMEVGDAVCATGGLSGQHLFIVPREAPGKVMVFNRSTWARVSGNEFPRAGGTNAVGLAWDSNPGLFRHVDSMGRIWDYSSRLVDQTVTGQYTWYDGDSGGTGTHETNPSPSTTATIAARSFAVIETPLPPDVAITDPARADKADRVGIYLTSISGDTPRYQTYLAKNVRSYTVDVINTSSGAAPLAQPFAASSAGAGKIQAAAKRQDGKPNFEVLGDGSGRFDALLPPGTVQMYAGGTIPTGWLACDGAGYSTATYPDLFAAIGYTFGGSSGTFYVPNLQNRFPLGSGSRAVGTAGGSETTQIPDHQHHAGPDLKTASATSSGVSVSGGTASSNVPRWDTFNNHTHSIQGQTGLVVGTNPAVSTMSPFLTLRFMIRT